MTSVLNGEKRDKLNDEEVKGETPYKLQIVWRNVVIFTTLHFLSYKAFAVWDWRVFWIYFVYGWFTSYGITAGAHRYWCHRSFKANLKLQYLLLFFQTAALQNSVIEWVRDHRVHHKYSETNADPHDSRRGFFFSHMGWLMCKKHPDVKKYGSKIDMSDLTSDPKLVFQEKHYIPLILLACFILPTIVALLLFPVSFKTAFYMTIFRYQLTLHLTWCTNSFAHMGSWKPYDKNIQSADSRIVGFFTFGEGWHNFHHTFPWDYKVSELPLYRYNMTLIFLDFMAWLGWATDLKVASNEMIKKRVLRTGDGTHPFSKLKQTEDTNNNESMEICWGIGDKDMPDDEIRGIETWCRKYD